MDDLIVDHEPSARFRAPIAILAFEGWNDAASAATGAARYLGWKLGARRFAEIDAQPFYDFRSVRPTSRALAGGRRDIRWPQNHLSYIESSNPDEHLLIVVGTEPSMRWRRYSEIISGVLERFQARLVITLGALLSDTPHTRPVRVTGTAMATGVADCLGLTPSSYEGPTGIVGVLHRALTEAEIDAASLWANVPHYLTTERCPPATLALLRRLEAITGRKLELRDLEQASERFQADVARVLADNEDARAYVKRLEAAHDALAAETDGGAGPLPAAEDIIGDIERFLRQDRDDG